MRVANQKFESSRTAERFAYACRKGRDPMMVMCYIRGYENGSREALETFEHD